MNDRTDAATRRKPLRLWPGLVLAVLLALVWLGLPIVSPNAGAASAIGGMAGGVAIALWWMFFSRAVWTERLGALVLMIVALAATPPILHESIATGGMGVLYFVYAVPVLGLAFVAWAVSTRRLPDGIRRATGAATIVVACAGWALLRTPGVSSTGSDFRWRWSETPEERLLTRTADEPRSVAPALEIEAGPDWPGFRGPGRDGVVAGVRIGTDWSASPPVELWRRSIGPGWSSFAVQGDLIYTQEQRGDEEIVACYRATTGDPVWRHTDATRFWESNGGAGPRATPTWSGGRIFAFGATGILNALDAHDGTRLWARDVASDTDVEVPYWGFAASPLVVDDLVVVAAAGRLVAYDLATGDPRWLGPEGGQAYSSPHRLAVGGVPQILLLDGGGVTSVAPNDGTPLWGHRWSGSGIVQPALTEEGDLLIGALSAASGLGIRRLGVGREADGWTVAERWTSSGLKPYFNDFVVHDGHAYGFDGSILASIDLADGQRNWKGGRYGHGQLVLLADQSLLLVVTERGELALVSATPDRFTELARLAVLEGKTWNHPVVVGDLLLVRNGQEMAAFRLPA